jgi:hypothetical protein
MKTFYALMFKTTFEQTVHLENVVGYVCPIFKENYPNESISKCGVARTSTPFSKKKKIKVVNEHTHVKSESLHGFCLILRHVF